MLGKNKGKKKINLFNIFRICVQIIFFIFLPTIFSYAFNGIKGLITVVSNGSFEGLTSINKVGLIVIIFVILFGRYFCGWVCSFGAYNDLIYFLGKKIKKKNNIQIERYDKYLKYFKYVVLLAIVILCITGNSSFINGKSPWDTFGQLISFKLIVSGFAIAFIIFILVTIGALFIERFFCRYICPLGAIFALVDRLHFFELHKPSEKCGKCKVCSNECPMGISLYKDDVMKSSECIKCYKCMGKCPRKNFKLKIFNTEVNKYVVTSIVLVLFIILMFVLDMINY